MKIILFICIVYLFSIMLNGVIEVWQSIPIYEEKSMPLYITKNLYE